jgi:hypothetical protein
MKGVGVFAEQDEIFGRGNFGNDRPTHVAFSFARADPPAPEKMQGGGEAEREEQQRDGDDARDEITH